MEVSDFDEQEFAKLLERRWGVHWWCLGWRRCLHFAVVVYPTEYIAAVIIFGFAVEIGKCRWPNISTYTTTTG